MLCYAEEWMDCYCSSCHPMSTWAAKMGTFLHQLLMPLPFCHPRGEWKIILNCCNSIATKKRGRESVKWKWRKWIKKINYKKITQPNKIVGTNWGTVKLLPNFASFFTYLNELIIPFISLFSVCHGLPSKTWVLKSQEEDMSPLLWLLLPKAMIVLPRFYSLGPSKAVNHLRWQVTRRYIFSFLHWWQVQSTQVGC
jgi:hypothetical protein